MNKHHEATSNNNDKKWQKHSVSVVYTRDFITSRHKFLIIYVFIEYILSLALFHIQFFSIRSSSHTWSTLFGPLGFTQRCYTIGNWPCVINLWHRIHFINAFLLMVAFYEHRHIPKNDTLLIRRQHMIKCLWSMKTIKTVYGWAQLWFRSQFHFRAMN